MHGVYCLFPSVFWGENTLGAIDIALETECHGILGLNMPLTTLQSRVQCLQHSMPSCHAPGAHEL